MPASRCRRAATAFSSLLLLLLAAADEVRAVVYTVGADAACTHASLQAAIDAAQGSPGPDEIQLAGNQSYTAVALSIGQQDLILTGGYSDCADTTPVGATLLNGQGGSAAPVVSITGSGVRDLRNLSIIRGDASMSNGSGGGINFRGRGELILSNVALTQNQAAYGGGINFDGEGGPAFLTLRSGAFVLLNTAQVSGGGVRIEGTARMFMLEPQSGLHSNLARGIDAGTGDPLGGFGGGLLVLAPATADIGSPGSGSAGAVFDNQARRGGGIAVIAAAGDGADAALRLFATDPTSPVRVHGNRAIEAGGGLYAKPRAPVDCVGSCEYAAMCLQSFRLDDNRAPEGAAVFADFDPSPVPVLGPDEGAFVYMNAGCLGGAFPEDPAALGAVSCADSPTCNRIDGQRVENLDGSPTGGAVLRITSSSSLLAANLRVVGNVGGTVISATDVGEFRLRQAEVVGNTLSAEVLRLSHGSPTESHIESVTLAGNSIGAASVLRMLSTDGGAVIDDNILWQPGKTIFSFPGTLAGNLAYRARYNVASEVASLPPDPTNRGSDVRFNDPPVGDYRVRISSPAVDLALPGGAGERDLAGRPRNVRVTPPPNQLTRDAGAHERQINDPYLVNGVFYGTLSQWRNDLPAFASYDATRNDGTDGTGSFQIVVPVEQVPAGTTRMHALTQCFNVPFPGTYRLTARGQANGGLRADSPIVNWRLRTASIDCSGPATTEGNLFLPGSTAWNSPVLPVEIVVTPAQWNFQTTIEISLGVGQSANDVAPTGLIARFDNVALTLVDGQPQADFVFSDGFE
jgi:hypothetical protein